MTVVKSQKGFGAVEAILVIVIIGLAGVLVWTFLNKSPNAVKGGTTQTNTTQKADTLSTDAVIAKAKNRVSAKYTLKQDDSNGQDTRDQITATEVRVSESKSSPGYLLGGYNFAVSYDGGATADLRAKTYEDPVAMKLPSKYTAEVRNLIADAYKESGLTQTGTRGNKEESTLVDVYMGKGLICTVDAVDDESDAATASCGELSRYEDAAKKIKPLAAVVPDVTRDTLLNNLEIKEAVTKGYKRASLNMSTLSGFGGAFVELYKKDGSEWQYFRTAQSIGECSIYNTPDLKSAFKGDKCWISEGGESTVQ